MYFYTPQVNEWEHNVLGLFVFTSVSTLSVTFDMFTCGMLYFGSSSVR